MKPEFTKSPDGLVPVIIQDHETSVVLMLGYMNEAALEKTKRERLVTFFSRSKNRLWTKGEESGNFLEVNELFLDCDSDTILVKATPAGPVCHTGADTCFNERNDPGFLTTLEKIIRERRDHPITNSYTSKLFHEGVKRVAQKVGEEAVELVIESMSDDHSLFINEAADLFFHYLVLLRVKETSFNEVVALLKSRHAGSLAG
jgi:phosphoribosyl-ATP pyrophosphohydrolase/phosphoribosyl-AMP cyclohydrolase